MTGTEFVRLWETTPLLREYVIQQAQRYAGQYLDIEDGIQESWIRISQDPADRDIDYYKAEASKAIRNVYYRERRRLQRLPLIYAAVIRKPASAIYST